MNNELLSWLVPAVMIILGGSIAWIVRLAIQLTVLEKDNQSQTKEIERLAADLAAHVEWDRAQHKELFDSRNEANVLLAEIKTVLENMAAEVKEILDRERKRNGIH